MPMKLGFEFECILKAKNYEVDDEMDDNERRDVLQDINHIIANLDRKLIGKGWQAANDSSIQYEADNEQSREYRSPAFTVEHIGDIVGELFDAIDQQEISARCNETCGFHVHASLDKQIEYLRLYNKEFCEFFRKEYDKDFKTEVDKERLTNRYCKPWAAHEIENSLVSYSWRKIAHLDKETREKRILENDRYRMVNFQAYQQHGTIEFRIFRAEATRAHVTRCLTFVVDTINKWFAASKKKYEFVRRKKLPENKIRKSKVNKVYNLEAIACVA